MPGLLDPRVRRPGRLASGDLLPEPLHQQTAGGPVPRRRAGNCPARACGLVLHRSTSLGRHGVYSRHASTNAPPLSVLAPTRLTGASWTATPDDRPSSTHRNRIREDPNGIRGAVVQARRAFRPDGSDRRPQGEAATAAGPCAAELPHGRRSRLLGRPPGSCTDSDRLRVVRVDRRQVGSRGRPVVDGRPDTDGHNQRATGASGVSAGPARRRRASALTRRSQRPSTRVTASFPTGPAGGWGENGSTATGLAAAVRRVVPGPG